MELGPQHSEAVDPGSNPSPYLHFFLNFLKKFRDHKFSETKMGSPRSFSALWGKKFSTEKRDTPHLSSIIFCPYQKISETQKRPLTKFFGPVKPKIFDKTMIPPSHAWKYSIPEFLSNTLVFPCEFFGTVRQKILKESRDIPSFA